MIVVFQLSGFPGLTGLLAQLLILCCELLKNDGNLGL